MILARRRDFPASMQAEPERTCRVVRRENGTGVPSRFPEAKGDPAAKSRQQKNDLILRTRICLGQFLSRSRIETGKTMAGVMEVPHRTIVGTFEFALKPNDHPDDVPAVLHHEATALLAIEDRNWDGGRGVASRGRHSTQQARDGGMRIAMRALPLSSSPSKAPESPSSARCRRPRRRLGKNRNIPTSRKEILNLSRQIRHLWLRIQRIL